MIWQLYCMQIRCVMMLWCCNVFHRSNNFPTCPWNIHQIPQPTVYDSDFLPFEQWKRHEVAKGFQAIMLLSYVGIMINHFSIPIKQPGFYGKYPLPGFFLTVAHLAVKGDASGMLVGVLVGVALLERKFSEVQNNPRCPSFLIEQKLGNRSFVSEAAIAGVSKSAKKRWWW